MAADINITVQTRSGRQCASSGSKWEPILGYSRAVRSGAIIAVTGTVGVNADGTYSRSMYEQTHRSLQIVKAAIEALPPQYRITVLLADVEGFSYNDIAEITNVKKGTVMSRLFRGRRLLQKALVDQARSAGFAGGKQ